jgi:hypothetical protein
MQALGPSLPEAEAQKATGHLSDGHDQRPDQHALRPRRRTRMNCAEEDAVASMLQTDRGGAAATSCTTPTRPKTRKATRTVARTLLFAKGNGVARTSPSTACGRACPIREKSKAHPAVVVVAGVVLGLRMGASDFNTNVFVLALVVGVNTPTRLVRIRPSRPDQRAPQDGSWLAESERGGFECAKGQYEA